MNAIEAIEKEAARIKAGDHERVRPGQTVRFTAAASPGDCIRQGDLYLIAVDRVPDGYTLSANPSQQLVPGSTQGAKHCLDVIDGVAVYLPPAWSEQSLDGPVIVVTRERIVMHPTHGHVVIPAGMTIACRYQREFDAELRRERRNAD